MPKAVVVKFCGEKTDLIELVNQEILTPQQINGTLIYKLSDIRRLFERVCDLEAVVNTIRELVNDATAEESDETSTP